VVSDSSLAFNLAQALVALDRISLGQFLASLLPGRQQRGHARGRSRRIQARPCLPLDLVERRLGEIHVAKVDQWPHEPEQQREQQRADVLAVDVGVGHQDDLVVAQLADVEVLTHPGAEGANQRLHLLVAENLVDPRLLDVEDLPADRQDRLGARSRPLLAEPPAESPSTIEDLAFLGLVDWQSDSCRQSSAAQKALAPGGFTCLAGGHPGRGGPGSTCGSRPRASLDGCRAIAELGANHALDERLRLVLPSLVFVWPSNWGSASLTGMTAVSPSRMSSPVRFSSFSLRGHCCGRIPLISVVSAAAETLPRECHPSCLFESVPVRGNHHG